MSVPRGGRLLVAGDSHGGRRELDTLMTASGFTPRQDVLALCGDLIDRGADSPGMLQILGFDWTHSVLGNHEFVAIDALNGGLDASVTWAHSGGAWADLLSERERDQMLSILVGLPDALLVDVAGWRVGVVHAGFPDALEFEAGFRHADRRRLIYGPPPRVCPSDLDLLIVGHRATVPTDPGIVCLETGAHGVLMGLDVGRAIAWRVSSDVMSAKVDPRIQERLSERRPKDP